MAIISQARAFLLFHLMLGLVVFVESALTVYRVLSVHLNNPLGAHLALLAGIEAIAALLFIIPRTVKVGSWLLLAVFVFALIVHGIQNELALLVYAAGVILVMTRQ